MEKTKLKLNLNDLSEEELIAEIQRRESAKKEAAKKAREDYEEKRDILVIELVKDAILLHTDMKQFKQFAIEQLNNFKGVARKYGDVRSNSKGGFSLRSNDGKMKVSFDRNIEVEYDERADAAEQLIRDFLGDMVKKKDQAAYEIIMSLLERGKSGKFNPVSVNALMKMEDKYNDERWTRAMKLFKESYNVREISMSVSFYVKNEMEKDEAIILTFASIPVDSETDQA